VRLCVLAGVVALAIATAAGDPDASVERGWELYRAGDFVEAERIFTRALEETPRSADAAVGLGYASLQTQGPARAAVRFQAVLDRQPDHDDALRGLVLAGRRAEADPTLRRSALRAARKLAKAHPADSGVELDLLALQAATGGPSERRPRGRTSRGGPLQVPVRALTDYLEIRSGETGETWTPILVKGVNLGLALPGRWPSQFPEDPALYASWLASIADLGANTVRAYTLLPPVFYRALAEHNARGDRPKLWLVQGVWTELPPRHDFGQDEAIAAFHAEIARVIDAVHGNLELAPRPGHAAGRYTADASASLLALVIGREWEPFAVRDYLSLRPGSDSWTGKWLRVRDGNAMERWVAARCEFAVEYEASRYAMLHPVTFASWPTLDPLSHPTESDRAEEDVWRGRLGLPALAPVKEAWDNDAVTVDPVKIGPTAAMRAGFFASYHVYPNYPDFLNLDPVYAATPGGPYAAYLQALKDHHGRQPVLIAEFGMSTSRGIAHVQPGGWHHGGMSEAEQGEIEARLLRSIRDTRCAGGIVFSWLDEWWKGTWSVARLEVPAERRRLWLNVESPEQNYGLLAARPASLSLTLDGDASDWPGEPADLQAAADEAYLWVLVRAPGLRHVRLALDTYAPERGERSLPEPGPAEVETGVEFLVDLEGRRGRVTVTAPYEPYGHLDGGDLASPATPSGRFVPLQFESNRERIARDGRRFPAITVERGRLMSGTDFVAGKAAVELRLPWSLLNVADPSSRRVLHQEGARGEELGTVVTEGFRLYAFLADSREPEAPPSRRLGPLAFTWPGWEEPRYRLEPKAGLPALRAAMQALEPMR
jgi:tetratricopeptide (TPR) repeat protein